MAQKFSMPGWAEAIESVHVRPAWNGYVVNVAVVGPEPKTGGASRRWDEQTFIFATSGEMDTFVGDVLAMKSAKKKE